MSGMNLARLGASPHSPFPPTDRAMRHPNGLLAFGGGLEPERLLRAYRQGIFPWYSKGEPILWWSPSPRCVIVPRDVHLSSRTRRRYNSGAYLLTADTAFHGVIGACAGSRPGQRGTWITDELRDGFVSLHLQGHAHSMEVWSGDALVGGIYGLALGRMFFGESMFSHAVDASKIALVALCRHLDRWGFGLIDAQVTSGHLLSMGAVEMRRSEFEATLRALVESPSETGRWTDSFRPEPRW